MEVLFPWLLVTAMTVVAGNQGEHKVPYIHNIVLYPDKHSWCKTTEIKQIVAYPGCSSIEIDNNVCVGACFSYSIPKTVPSAPGEVITPYCDSCQPVNVMWKEVKLNCSDDSEEEGGSVELTKQVQVITNCSCSSCHKQHDHNKHLIHHKNHDDGLRHDVPELMKLMMTTHNTRYQVKNDSESEPTPQIHHLQKETEENSNENEKEQSSQEKKEETIKTSQEEKEDERNDDEMEEKTKSFLKNLEKHQLEKKENLELQKIKELQKLADENKEHYVLGPHHSLVLKKDTDDTFKKVIIPHHKPEEDEEETPSLLANQDHIHDNEEILDQLAVESVKKEVEELPQIIYKLSNSSREKTEKDNMTIKDEVIDDKWQPKVVDIDHHHLKPAEEGIELSYGKHHDEE